jgi:hypothetical protein
MPTTHCRYGVAMAGDSQPSNALSLKLPDKNVQRPSLFKADTLWSLTAISVMTVAVAFWPSESLAAQGPPRGGTAPVVVTQRIHRDLPPYTFKLTPNLGREPCSQGRCFVGTIDISVNANSESLQTIKVYSFADVSWFTRRFAVRDNNFDGFDDISVVDDFGATWGAFHHWLFEPESGRFVSDNLAKQLDQLSGNKWEYDSAAKEIKISSLIGGCPESWRTFRIITGRVTLVRAEEYIQPFYRAGDPPGKHQSCMTVRSCFTQTTLRGIPPEAHSSLMFWTYDNSVPEDLPWRLREVSAAGFLFSPDHTNTPWDQVMVKVYNTPDGWKSERVSGRGVPENACQE